MRYAQVRSIDISNGEGIGVSLFVQGCPFNPHCYNCFNPETWDFNGGKKWTPEVKERFLGLIDRPYIKRVSILGGEPLADENLDGVIDLVAEINKRYKITQDIVYSGNTNHNILNENADKTRLSSPKKSIWLYTGYTWEQIINNAVYINPDCHGYKRRQIVKNVDFLVDGRFEADKMDLSLKFRGSSNQRIIDVQQSLVQDKVITYE